MEDSTKKYLTRRIYPLVEVGRLLKEDFTTTCTLMNTLKRRDSSSRQTSRTETFSSTIGWYRKDRKMDTRIFVKMYKANVNDISIPKTFINELYLMKTVIRDIFRTGKSPHFSYPVGQYYSTLPKGDIRDMEEYLSTHPDRGCLYQEGVLGIYNITEYFDPSIVSNVSAFLSIPELGDDEVIRGLKMIVFQTFYNLSLMEGMKFRHGDLHLQNVLVAPMDAGYPNLIHYHVDETTRYEMDARYFIFFIDFDRSSIYTEEHFTLTPSETEFKAFPCLPPSKVSSQAPYGLSEACHGWNPHADWTRFVSGLVHQLVKTRGVEGMNRMMAAVFGESILVDMIAVIGSFEEYPAGRVSLQHLMDQIQDKTILNRCTPTNLLKRFAENVSGENWIKELGAEPKTSTTIPVFKAY